MGAIMALVGAGLFAVGTLAPFWRFGSNSQSLIGIGEDFGSGFIVGQALSLLAPLVVVLVAAILALVNPRFAGFAAGASLGLGFSNLMYLLSLAFDVFGYDADLLAGIWIALLGSGLMMVGGFLLVLAKPPTTQAALV
jgi:hypothetical protein